MIYLRLDELLRVAERATGAQVLVRDHGLLASAAARPQASAFGEDAYPDLVHKAAALMQSLASNHPLVDGNKRLALGATIAMLGLNGARLDLTEDEAYDLTIAVATGEVVGVGEIAARLRTVPLTR